MNSSLPSPPPTAPFGSATGAALDVIVVVPSSSSSPLRRSSSRGAAQCQHCNGSSSSTVPASRGVIASSDFFVTFPSGMAWSNSPLKKSLTKKSSTSVIRSFFYGKSSSTLTSSTTSAGSSGSGGKNKSIESIREENGNYYDLEEEGVEAVMNVADGNVGWDNSQHSTMSEMGTSCTDPHSHDLIPQSQIITETTFASTNNAPRQRIPQPQQQQQQPLNQQRKGNVHIQINGRYIPQLDMIFSSKRGNASSSFLMGSSTGGGSGDDLSCRFVNGNGLRPPTGTLGMLINNDTNDCGDDIADETMEQSCTCSEAIRNSEHHLCPATQQNKDGNESTQKGPILNYGRNLLRYTLFSKKGTIVATAESHLYLWKSSDSVVVSDVDGTVTKSDVRGVIDTVITDKFEYCHEGICKFFHDMLDGDRDNAINEERREETSDDCSEDGCREEHYDSFTKKGQQQPHLNPSQPMGRTAAKGEIRFLYLSSRPISLIGQSRKLLLSLSQTSSSNQSYGLPPGPVFHHTGPLSSVLYSELVAKDIHEFKADVLARQVVLPFVAARGEDWRISSSRGSNVSGFDDHHENNGDYNPRPGLSLGDISEASSVWDDRLFLAGFGNKVTDAMAYEMAGIDRRDIYIIDKESRILCMGYSGEEGRNSSGLSERSTSCSSEPKSLSVTKSTTNTGAICDQSEDWPLADVCCPGGVDVGQQKMSPELSESLVHASNAPASNANRIHSIELSLSAEKQLDGASESLTLSKTAVDIYVTNDQSNLANSATVKRTKRSKIKQSIRAFSSKKSFNNFPSFSSSVSSSTKKTSRKKLYEGYGDPLLLQRVLERMIA